MKANMSAPRIVGLVFIILGSIFMLLGFMFLYLFYSATGPVDPDFLLLGIVLPSTGAIFFCVGLGLLIGARQQRKNAERLMLEGTCYEATIVRAYFNQFVQANGRSPLVLECQYTDNGGSVHLVKSKNLWNANLLTKPADFHARVWVDPYNAKKYHVEVVDEPLAPQRVDYDDR